MQTTPIHRIQGPDLFSPLEGREVTTRGVVTGKTGRGFFIQDPDGIPGGPASHGVFVFERRGKPPLGSLVQVSGRAIDYQSDENARPTTQIEEHATRVLRERGPRVEPVWLTAELVRLPQERLAAFLNRLEGMLVGLPAGSTFVAPSNPFGDYVVLPPGASLARTPQGGVLIDPQAPNRWLPGFRVREYADAPRVHVGAELLDSVTGPLNFRADSFQVAAAGPIRVGSARVALEPTTLRGEGSRVTILTLNGFNLDAQVERADRVQDPERDVDDDLASGRFDALAQAIVRDAVCPDIVALQEIQDDDGAELSEVVSAERTLERLTQAVLQNGGPVYRYADVPPRVGADGGQPGGNIRNAFLYQPERVSLVPDSLRRLGEETEIFEGSRKPLAARFALRAGAGELEVVNVHLASKRHQYGLFAPERPGFDPRLSLRVQQAEFVASYAARLRERGVDYYITGDFNDFEFSPTLEALVGDHSTNLTQQIPAALRFDYNHRGVSQALMHGIVANAQLDGREAEYEILPANALRGIDPGRVGGKPSDHAYVIARLQLGR